MTTTIDQLRQLFPATFTDPPQPLMRFIHTVIAKRCPEIDHDSLCATLNAYTSSPDYLRNCTSGAPRLDLDGAAKGKVTAIEAFNAMYRADHGQWPEQRLQNQYRKLIKREKRIAEIAAAEALKPKKLSLTDLKEAAKARQSK